ncbi:hypothetical protein ACOSQ4_014016 [Xanthoceras sorbifolium]
MVGVRRGQSGSGSLVGVSGKKKTWKGESFIEESSGGFDNKNPIQTAKEVVNGGGGSGGGTKKSPVQALKKGRF